jgi:recombination protein RecR
MVYESVMSKRIAGPEIERLIQLLAKVPGLGPRSARRAALLLIKKKSQIMGPLAQAMQEAHDKVRICTVCGNADTSDPCTICCDDRRNSGVIVVVEDVADLWALERAGAIANARYHVLGGRLSPLDGACRPCCSGRYW